MVIWYYFSLYFFIFLHEMGHGLMAKYFNTPVRDILLSPLGGLTRLTEYPTKPKQEIAIALGGPLVNLIILVTSLVVVYIYNVDMLGYTIDSKSSFIIKMSYSVILINAILFSINLIPALPLDGGRILRGLLLFKWVRSKATLITYYISLIIGIVISLYGFHYQNSSILFLGCFLILTYLFYKISTLLARTPQ